MPDLIRFALGSGSVPVRSAQDFGRGSPTTAAQSPCSYGFCPAISALASALRFGTESEINSPPRPGTPRGERSWSTR
jgi:hypothetical protein